jgi:signal transduction histidine kinase/response regulator RpfG family c-di-GMP phosphodiesterase
MNSSNEYVLDDSAPREEVCPVSGLAVVRLPAFADIRLGDNHYASLSKIGNSIVCIECRGYQGNYDAAAMDHLNDTIERFCNQTGVTKPYVQIYNKKAETGKHSLKILRREVSFFQDNQDTIKGLILLQGKSWLTHFTGFALHLYKPSMKVMTVESYSEAIISAQNILNLFEKNTTSTNIIAQKLTVNPEDIVFRPEWEYKNKQTGFVYQVGLVPHLAVIHSLHNDMSSMDDVRRSAELLEKCYKVNDFVKDLRFSIVDLTNIAGKTPLLMRISYAKEIRKLNKLYNQWNVTQVIITNNKFYQNAAKLFFYMVRQKIIIVETVKDAFSYLNSEQHKTQDNRNYNAAITVTPEDLDELHTIFSQLLLTEGEDDFQVSEKNPLGYLVETIRLLKQEIIDLREKDRLNAEERLKESEKTRIKQLEMLKNLEEATARAEAASKAKSEFLVNMSHEIRTPLNGVIGFTDLLKHTPLSPVQLEYVENANVSGHTLLGIINDILDFSKIEAGMFHLEMIRIDLIDLLEECTDIVKYSAGKKDLEILLNIDTSTPRFVVTDPIRLKQILANLLGNAVKFTENGEVELKVRYEQLTNNKGKLFFAVRDTGIGISDTSKDKLFKAFSQADSSTTRKFGGTGLGLIISDMIAQKMGSKIQFDSTLGEGTTFYFEIVAETEISEISETGRPLQLRNCLIIDDNSINRMILENMLGRWHIVCKSVDSGLSALRLLETSEHFDCIICDYTMPKPGGLETIQLIREQLKLTTKMPQIILLYPSNDCSDILKKCDELGIPFRISKPIKKRDLYNCLLQNNAPSPDRTTTVFNDDGAKHSLHQNEKKQKILIVEDVKMNMLVITTLLGKILPFAELIEVSNGSEAVRMFKEIRPDLILMDVQMPEMDGLEATRQIRILEQNSYRHVPIIALTAGAFKEEQEKCLIAGMDEFLTKPINPEKTKKILIKYLSETE